MRKKPPISKEDLIQKIEARLQEPDLPLREFTSLTKRLANLRGWVEQGKYVRVSPSQALNAQREEPESFPNWWSDSWCQIFIAERARGICGGWWRWQRELDKLEANWAAQENLSVPELREALRREDMEYKAQHSTEERLGYNQMCRIEWDRAHPAQYLGVKPEETKQ